MRIRTPQHERESAFVQSNHVWFQNLSGEFSSEFENRRLTSTGNGGPPACHAARLLDYCHCCLDPLQSPYWYVSIQSCFPCIPSWFGLGEKIFPIHICFFRGLFMIIQLVKSPLFFFHKATFILSLELWIRMHIQVCISFSTRFPNRHTFANFYREEASFLHNSSLNVPPLYSTRVDTSRSV